MITGCIIAYNESAFIAGAIESLKPHCDRIIVIDGAYKGFPLINDNPESTDGTLQISESMGADVRHHGLWEDQIDKRNEYLNLCRPGDFILHLDADERLVCEGGLRFDRNIPAHRIEVEDPIYNTSNSWIRLFEVRKGLHYQGAHNLLFQGDRLLDDSYCPILQGATIDHLEYMKTPDRKDRCSQYYAFQYEQEREFRLKVGKP